MTENKKEDPAERGIDTPYAPLEGWEYDPSDPRTVPETARRNREELEKAKQDPDETAPGLGEER